jgi:hypothetical protein
MTFIELIHHIKHFRNKKINIAVIIVAVIVSLLMYIINLGSSMYVEKDISVLSLIILIAMVIINFIVLMLWVYAAYDMRQYLKRKSTNYRLSQIEKVGIFSLVISYPIFILQEVFLFPSLIIGLIGICNLIIGIKHYKYCGNLLSAALILNGLAIFCSGYLLAIEWSLFNTHIVS